MGKEKKAISTVMFSSFQGGIGKTFIASEFAVALFKKTGRPVAMIELNMLRPSTIVENIGDDLHFKTSFLDYYMGNWRSLTHEKIPATFTAKDGVFYIPFCGNRESMSLMPSFHLSESDLQYAFNHLLNQFAEMNGIVVIDCLFQLSPLPAYLLHRCDVLAYIYSSTPPSPSYAQKFMDEVNRHQGMSEKLLWIRNYAENASDKCETSLFDPEHAVPLSAEIAGNIKECPISGSMEELVEKVLQFSANGKCPKSDIHEENQVPEEIITYQRMLRTEVLGELEKNFGISDFELREKVEFKIDEAMKRNPPPRIPGHNSEAEVKKFLVDDILGLGPLEEFMRDDEIDEIMVNGPDKVFVEKNGRLVMTERKFNNADHVRTVIERILMPVGRTVNERTPYVDARLLDGSRVHAIIPPLSLTGPMITIRKFSRVPYTMNDLVYRFKSVSLAVAEFLKICVHLKKNIIVSGGASSGKTTLLNVLSNFILPSERVICIEDSAELRLGQDNLGRLEARQQGTEAKTQVTIRDLVRNALRMRPDRIIVGECRGPEAIDMLQAMNTGHDGSLTTLHANSPRDALARLETMVLMAGVDLPLRAIREQIASSVNIVVQNGRLADGNRKMLEVVEVTGIEDNNIKTQTIFKFEKQWITSDGQVVGEINPTGFLPEFMKSIPGSFLEENAHLFKQKTARSNKEETMEI